MPAAAADAPDQERLLAGFGRTVRSRATVTAVSTPAAAADAVARAGARGALARGLGRAYGDAAQNAGGAVLDATALTEPFELDAERGMLRVGAGVALDELVRRTLPRGWFPAVVPGTGRVTVGGAIAADVHGKNHHRDGSFGDQLAALTLVDGRGAIVELDADADALRATIGGMGLTGVIVEAVMRLQRVETAAMLVRTRRLPDLDAVLAALADPAGPRMSVAWLDLSAGPGFGRGVLDEGDYARLEDLAPAERPTALALPRERSRPKVPWAPPGLIRPATIRLFDEAWFRRAPADATRTVPLGEFFFPLDRLRAWNRLYGSTGFVQHQLAVPADRADVIVSALQRLRAARSPIALAVLKRLGPGRGLLSFPIDGWTLALDLPARAPGLRGVLDAIDDDVAQAGGRLYFAKDARMRSELVPVMYPELDRWRALRSQLDPDHRLRSDLDRRLGIAG